MIDFPSNPTDGQVFTSGNSSWVWNATASQWRTSLIALNPKVQRLSGDGTTVQFTLNSTPPNINFFDVYITGLYQQKNTYTLSGNVLTFSEAPPTGTENIEVEWGSSLDVGVPSDLSVGTNKLQDASVTAAKLASGAAVGNLGYTPVNKAGDTLTGLLTVNGQIKFPVTQNASTDANTLDDYEEGTFTPVWVGEGSNPTCTYSEQSGVYCKIGRTVYFSIRIVTSSKSGGSGNLLLGGLPFTIVNGAARGMTSINFSYAWSAGGARDLILAANTTHMMAYSTDSAGSSNIQTPVSDLGSGTYMNVGGFYFV